MDTSQSITFNKNKQNYTTNRETFELLHSIRRICGFTPFHVYHADKKSHRLSVEITLRDSIVFVCCVAIYTFFGIKNFQYSILFNMTRTFVSKMGTILVTICGFLIAVGCPIMNIINRKKICKLFNMVETWDFNVSE